MTREELNKILENHLHWINEDIDGWEGMEADLRGADLREADLREAKNIPFIPLVCPSDGSFTAWKKCQGSIIVKLLIPEDAKRSSATTRKCRASKAVVLEIQDVEGNKIDAVAYGKDGFEYKVGETVYPDSFDEDRWNECSHGIHFFINRQEAVDY